MKDYKDLFYFKQQKDLLRKTIEDVDTIKSKLSFYDNEFDLTTLDKAFTELNKLYKELQLEVNKEKLNFTKEELKELHWIYNKSTK